MPDFDEIAKRVADIAQRVADVADAARGKGVRIGAGNSFARWLVLPAASAARFVRPEADAEERQFVELRSDGDLESHLRDRAARRQQRRESMSDR